MRRTFWVVGLSSLLSASQALGMCPVVPPDLSSIASCATAASVSEADAVSQDDDASEETTESNDDTPTQRPSPPVMVILVGAAGLPEYGEEFTAAAEAMTEVAKRAGFDSICVGLQDEPVFSNELRREQYTEHGDAGMLPTEDLGRFDRIIGQIEFDSASPFWLVMFGHGTFDGRTARFNLRGPDMTAKQLADVLSPIHRPTVIVNCSSSSAPFMNALSRPGRVVITSTRDGAEQNYSRFGSFFPLAFLSEESDLDKDDQVSLLEAFLAATHQVTEFYEMEKRLATEHALIDDNGDQRGTPSDWFVGVRVEREASSNVEPDGRRAHQVHLLPSQREEKMTAAQRAQREQLELEIDELRRRRSEMSDSSYLEQLDVVAAQLVEVYGIELTAEFDAVDETPTMIVSPQRGVKPPRPVIASDQNSSELDGE